MNQTIQEKNKALVLDAFDTLFNKRDYAAAEKYWSPNYIQHSAHIEPGRDGLFNLIRNSPNTLRYEHQLIVAEGGRGIERTAGGQALTLSYRLAGRARRWGLVTQRLTLTELGVPVVRPDRDADRFRRGWRRLPVLVRLWAWVLVPAFGIGLLVFGSRGFLVRRLGSQEDLPTP